MTGWDKTICPVKGVSCSFCWTSWRQLLMQLCTPWLDGMSWVELWLWLQHHSWGNHVWTATCKGHIFAWLQEITQNWTNTSFLQTEPALKLQVTWISACSLARPTNCSVNIDFSILSSCFKILLRANGAGSPKNHLGFGPPYWGVRGCGLGCTKSAGGLYIKVAFNWII